MAGFWILFFLFFGIFFWSILPPPLTERSFPVDSRPLIFLNQDCQIDRTLKNITFHTKYPAFLYFGETAKFEVFVEKELLTNISSANDCKYAFEIYLEMSNAFIAPNNRVIQPAADSYDQLFIFEIQPADFKRVKAGDLWIYIITTPPDAKSVNRLPLFVIPVEIKLRSLLGIPLPWLRLVSLSVVFTLLIARALNLRSG